MVSILAVSLVGRTTMRMRMAVSPMRMRITLLRTRMRTTGVGLQTVLRDNEIIVPLTRLYEM